MFLLEIYALDIVITYVRFPNIVPWPCVHCMLMNLRIKLLILIL